MDSIKLNIGAGDTRIDGFIPIDRQFGTEAYPLPQSVDTEDGQIALADNSVDEIRASHILEHFSMAEGCKALAEWVRVLKPGGRIRISVPDVDKVLQSSDARRLFFLMGGQTDRNDFHMAAYDQSRLTTLMEECGLGHIQAWQSDNTDTASNPISLNLEGVKVSEPPEELTKKDLLIRVQAYMTLPRYEAVATRSLIEHALKPLRIGLTTSQGVFYGQCMQRMLERALGEGIDWLLTLDSDSLFTSEHVSLLLDEFGQHPEADAMAALQCRRGKDFPLMTVGHENNTEVDGSPIKATTAHFGMTLIRASALADLPKPWFYGEPDKNGEWSDDRMDPDIWFWHQWRLAGKSIYVTPRVSIGHMEEMVRYYDSTLNVQTVPMSDWRKHYLGVVE